MKAFKLKTNFITDEMFLGFDEAERFIRAAPVEWLAFLIVAIKTGLRLGELLALKWEDIDLVPARSSFVERSGTAKRVHRRAA